MMRKCQKGKHMKSESEFEGEQKSCIACLKAQKARRTGLAEPTPGETIATGFAEPVPGEIDDSNVSILNSIVPQNTLQTIVKPKVIVPKLVKKIVPSAVVDSPIVPILKKTKVVRPPNITVSDTKIEGKKNNIETQEDKDRRMLIDIIGQLGHELIGLATDLSNDH